MNILLREITNGDMAIVLSWRNNPLVYAGFYNQGYMKRGPIPWEEHLAWWESRHNWQRWIIQLNDGHTTRDVGCIQISHLDGWNPELGIYIGDIGLWGKGVGKQALLMSLEWLREQNYKYANATILKSNERSLKLFRSVGFEVVGPAREAEVRVEMKL